MRVPGRRARNFGFEAAEVLGQQEQREHGGLRDVGLVHVPLDERGAIGDAGFLGQLPREFHHLGVVLDAQRPGAAFGGGNHHPAVTRPEIDHEVISGHLRQVQHLLDKRRRCRNPDGVLPLLTGYGLEILLSGRLNNRRGGEQQ